MKRRIERKRMMDDARRIRRQRESLGETTIKVVTLLKQSPLESRQAFAVDLLGRDGLGDRINSAWLIIRGKRSDRVDVSRMDEHETEAV